jgi:hypothetical protein
VFLWFVSEEGLIQLPVSLKNSVLHVFELEMHVLTHYDCRTLDLKQPLNMKHSMQCGLM